MSTGKIELFPISHASGLARPRSKGLKPPCRPASVCRERRRLPVGSIMIGTGPSALRGCLRDPASGAALLDRATCAHSAPESPAPLPACAGHGSGGWGGRAAGGGTVTTPLLKPAHPVSAEQTTLASVSSLCRSSALILMLV